MVKNRYVKQKWIDHIIDKETGEVIQQGTVHSEQRMNHMEEGIYNAANWYDFEKLEDRLKALEDAIFTDITSNPFRVTFDTLEGVEITGYWNKDEKRLEV